MSRSLLILLVAVGLSPAQGFVERLDPPVVERGKTTRVAIVGTGLGSPLDLWTTAGTVRAKPTGTATPTRAEFDMIVPADAPLGMTGFRMASIDGLSNASLFVIDDLPVKSATETIALPASIAGRFREAVVDRYKIEVSAGQEVAFEVVGNRLGKDVDPLVVVRDSRGKIVAERDNDPGLYFDCRFAHRFAEAGVYTVQVSDARYLGGNHAAYVLRMGRFPAARVAVPCVVRPGTTTEVRLPELGDSPVTVTGQSGLFQASVRRADDQGSAWLPLEAVDAEVTTHQIPGNTFEMGTPAKVPGMLCGVLRKPGERNYFRLDLAKGQKIQVRAEARALNSPADLEIVMLDPMGKEVRRTTENAQEEIAFDFNAGNAGVYGLAVRDLNRDGGPAFAYRVEVRTGQSRVAVTAEVEGLTVPRGSYQPISMTLVRTDAVGPVALELVGAPPGVTLTPSEFGEKETALVCRLSATGDAAIGLHTIQILARPTDGPASVVRTRPLIDRQIINVDLILHALREDQRRLPPALADRFAVQVTPASPFAFELPESMVTLARYCRAEFPLKTTRISGFDGPLSYSAKGGQIAEKSEGRTRVYAEFTAETGSIHSKILTNLAKHRVEVTAVGTHAGRTVSLTRTFELDVRGGFTVSPEVVVPKTEAGMTLSVRLNAERLKEFTGEVVLNLSPSAGLTFPERLTIPAGATSVEVPVVVAMDRQPGRVSVGFTSTGQVGGYEEEQRGRFEIEVVKTPMPPKK